MKKLVLVLVLMLFSVNAFAQDKSWEIRICGINLNVFSDAKVQDIPEIIAGIISSVAVHEAGHLLYLKCDKKNGIIKFHDNAFYTHTSDSLNEREMRRFNRSGFLAQVGSALVLSQISLDSYFTKAFVSTTSLDIWSYNLRHSDNGDFYNITNYGKGNGDREWSQFSILQLYNQIKISK